VLFEPHAIRTSFGVLQGEKQKLCHKRIERGGGRKRERIGSLLEMWRRYESQTGLGVGSWSQDLYLAMGK